MYVCVYVVCVCVFLLGCHNAMLFGLGGGGGGGEGEVSRNLICVSVVYHPRVTLVVDDLQFG